MKNKSWQLESLLEALWENRDFVELPVGVTQKMYDAAPTSICINGKYIFFQRGKAVARVGVKTDVIVHLDNELISDLIDGLQKVFDRSLVRRYEQKDSLINSLRVEVKELNWENN